MSTPELLNILSRPATLPAPVYVSWLAVKASHALHGAQCEGRTFSCDQISGSANAQPAQFVVTDTTTGQRYLVAVSTINRE